MSTTIPPVTTVPRRVGVVAALSSTDHKRIALMTLVAALGFFFAGGALALVMRTELAHSVIVGASSLAT